MATRERNELMGVIEVIEFDRSDTESVNRYLKAGWTLLSMYIRDFGEPGQPHQTQSYVLGWIAPEKVPGRGYEDDYGQPVHPKQVMAGGPSRHPRGI